MTRSLVSTIAWKEAQSTSFTTDAVVLDPEPACTMQCIVKFATGLNASAIAQGSVDGVRWANLSGTSQSISSDGSFLFILERIGGLRRVRLSVTLVAGIADFEVIAGVG